MKEKILKNLSYIFCLGLGLFTFILFAFPYLVIKMREGIVTNIGGKVSGYSIMAMFEYGFAGIMCAILQILVLLVATLMLVYGTIGLIGVFVKDKKCPIQIGKVRSQTLAKIAMLIYSALNALLLIFMIIVCVNDSQILDKIAGVYLFFVFAKINLIPSVSIYFAMFIPIALYFVLGFFGDKDVEEVEDVEEEEVENEEGLTLDDVIPTAQNMRK